MQIRYPRFESGCRLHPRATGDLDVLVRPSAANAPRVLAALRRFGAPLLDLTAEDLEAPGTVFQVGLPPVRHDLVTGMDGVSFEDAWESRVEREVDGLKVPFLGREALVRNKRAAGRPQDLADIERLERGG